MGDQVVARVGTAGRIEPLAEAPARGVSYEQWQADRDAVMAQRPVVGAGSGAAGSRPGPGGRRMSKDQRPSGQCLPGTTCPLPARDSHDRRPPRQGRPTSSARLSRPGTTRRAASLQRPEHLGRNLP